MLLLKAVKSEQRATHADTLAGKSYARLTQMPWGGGGGGGGGEDPTRNHREENQEPKHNQTIEPKKHHINTKSPTQSAKDELYLVK